MQTHQISLPAIASLKGVAIRPPPYRPPSEGEGKGWGGLLRRPAKRGTPRNDSLF
jgi:hypothetical protein